MAGAGSGWRRGGSLHRKRPTDGKGKAAPSGARKWLVGLRFSAIHSEGADGSRGIFFKEFNAPTAIHWLPPRASDHEHLRRRLPCEPMAAPRWRSRCQAADEFRRRGDAGRKEGRTRRSDLHAKRQKARGHRALVWARCGGVSGVACIQPARHGYGVSLGCSVSGPTRPSLIKVRYGPRKRSPTAKRRR